jgi:hypothetical protein
MAGDAEEKKINIKIEAIKTPLGEVPTLASLKQICEAMNILNADMIRTQETVNNEVYKQLHTIEIELKSLRKLMSEEIISFEAVKESINALNKRLDERENTQLEKINDLSKLIIDFIGSVRVFQDRMTQVVKKLSET